MQIAPINNYNVYQTNINYRGLPPSLFDMKLSEHLPVSLNPVKNITNSILKKITILSSNRCLYDRVESVKKYCQPVIIQHPKTNLMTEAWDINKNGTKNYVVVLHGLSHNITNLQDLYESIIKNTDYAILAPEYTDVCYPHKNRKTFSDKTIIDDSKAVISYLDKKGIARKDIVIVAHSFGGYVASTMAKEFPDIGKLILISPTDTFKHRIYSIENGTNPLIPKIVQFFVSHSNAAKQQLAHIYETSKLLSKVQCPTDIIYSKQDKLVKQEIIEHLASNCKNLHGLHILKEGSHRMDGTKIDEVVKILNTNE